MELSETRARHKRKFPNFMYGSTFPRDAVGSGGPSYGGALEWIQKHQDYLNQSLKYVQRYPNLVQERVLDPFWDLLEPLIHNNNLLVKYDEFLKTEFGLSKSHDLSTEKFGQQLPTPAAYFKMDTTTRRSDYTYPLRRAFFCYDRKSPHHEHLKHLLVDQLEPFLSIRTNPTAEQAKVVNSLDICRSICGAVFMFLLNDDILQDEVCVNLLSIAIAYKSPIIFLRESGYSLPTNLPDSKIEYVKIPDSAPFVPKHDDLVVKANHSNQSLDQHFQEAAALESEEEDVGEKILKEKKKRLKEKQIESELNVRLSTKIQALYEESLIFNPQMFETTLATICNKLGSYTGSAFPGSVPDSASEAAAKLRKPFNIGAMRLPEKPIYKVGTAKTTKGFHDTLKEGRQLNTTNINNNNNSEDCDETSVEEKPVEESSQSSCQETIKDIPRSPSSKSVRSPLHFQTYPTLSQREIESFDGRIIMVPTPPKVMRSGNMQGLFTDSYRAKGFRPNYPSNSRLLKYRPNSSLPFSIRSRVLLQTSIQRDSSATEMT